MECPNCFYVTAPGQVEDGVCPNCQQMPEWDQVSPTKTDFQAFGMPAPGEDDGNNGNPLAEGTIMGSDGEKPAMKRDNWMSKRTEMQPPLGFTAKDIEGEEFVPADEVEVIDADDLPKKRKDRDLEAIEAEARAGKTATDDGGNPVGNDQIPAEAYDSDSKEHPDGDRQYGLQVGDDVSGGGAQNFSDHALQQIADRLPEILKHAFSEEPTGDLDDLHQLLSQESPGYDQHDDPQGAMHMIVLGLGGDPNDQSEWMDQEQEGGGEGHDPMNETPHDEAKQSHIVEAGVFGQIGGFLKSHALDIGTAAAMAVPGLGEGALALRGGMAALKGAEALKGVGTMMGAARAAGGLAGRAGGMAGKAWNAVKWPVRLNAVSNFLGAGGMGGGMGGGGAQQGGMIPQQVQAPSYYSHHDQLAAEHRFALMQPGMTPPGQTTVTPGDVEQQAHQMQGRCPACGSTLAPGQQICPQCGQMNASLMGTDPSQMTASFMFGPGKATSPGVPTPQPETLFEGTDIPPGMTIQEWNKSGRPVFCDTCQNPTVDRNTGECSNCHNIKEPYVPPPEYEPQHTGAAPLFPPCPNCGEVAGFEDYPWARGSLWCKNRACQHIIKPEDLADQYNGMMAADSADLATLPETEHPLGPHTGAATQGPNTDEQKAAVAELLQKEQRGDEIPNMLLNPEQYAKELAQITGQDNPPTAVDPSQQAPPPAVDPSAMQGQGMPPGMSPMGPGGGMPAMARAINKYADTGGEVQNNNGYPAIPRPWPEEEHVPCPLCHGAAFDTDGYPCGGCEGTGERYNEVPDYPPSEVAADPLAEQYAVPSGLQWDDHRNTSVRTAEDHVRQHGDNFENQIGVDAADQVHQQDMEKQQDSGHTWQDENGQPLQVGQEYEMYSNQYDIPDMVRIEAVKPDSVQYTLTGEYGLDHSTEVSHQEAQMEDLAFSPIASNPSDQPGETDQNAEDLGLAQVGQQQTDLSTPSKDGFNQPLMSKVHEAMTARDYRFIADIIARAPVQEREALAQHFAQELANTNVRFDQDRFMQAALGQPGGRDVRDPNRDYPPDNQPGDLTVPQEWTASNRNWLKQGGADFTQMEQREFIDEAGVARNADKLDLSGTHYEGHVEADRDYFLFGL